MVRRRSARDLSKKTLQFNLATGFRSRWRSRRFHVFPRLFFSKGKSFLLPTTSGTRYTRRGLIPVRVLADISLVRFRSPGVTSKRVGIGSVGELWPVSF